MGADRVTAFIEISNAAHARGRDDEARDTLARALTAATEINEPKAEASALLRIADAQAATGWSDYARATVALAQPFIPKVPALVDWTELMGWGEKIPAMTGNFDRAVALIDPLAEDSDTERSYKARAYHDVGPL